MNDNNATHASWTAVSFVERLLAAPTATAGVRWNCLRHDLYYYNEEVRDSQSSLIGAIAQEISKIRGGRLIEHSLEARRLLKQAFRKMEQSKRTCSTREFVMIRDGARPGGSWLCGQQRGEVEST